MVKKRASEPEAGPSWKMRRRAVFGTLVFAAGIILLVAIRWDDTSLAETLVLSMSALMGSIVAAYTGFATWEDRGAIQQGHYEFPVSSTRRRREQEETEATSEEGVE